MESRGSFNVWKIKRSLSSLGLTSNPNLWAAWWGSALIQSPITSDHSLSHYLHCVLLHQKNICEHYLTNWSLNEPLAEGAFGLPLGSQSGCRRKTLTDAKQRLERERELSVSSLGGWRGQCGKGGGSGGNKPRPARKSTFSKGSCLLEAVVKLLNSFGASREKPKPLWTEGERNVASGMLVKKRKAGKQC